MKKTSAMNVGAVAHMDAATADYVAEMTARAAEAKKAQEQQEQADRIAARRLNGERETA